jgi:hypothetical protein
MKFFRLFLLIFGFYSLLCISSIKKSAAQDTLEVMYYNVLNFPGSTPQRVSYFRTINQYVRADVILITELIDDAGAESLLQDGLNVYGASNYQKAVFTDGFDTDNMLFYNSDKLTLYSQDTIETALRQINEYVLYYKSWDLASTDDTIFFYFYSAHLKASQGTENKAKRFAEVMHFKQHIDSIPNAENVFFGGDLNFYTHSEAAYNALIDSGSHPLVDPLPSGVWHDHGEYSAIHTQSPRKIQFGGGAYGGLDDRFDFILFTDDVVNGVNKISYIPNSCLAVGNDGNHFDLAIIDEPVNTAAPDSVINAMYYMSDHLPVICKLEVESSTVPQVRDIVLTACLEGPFSGANMSTGLSSELPLSQPYNTPPWNYNGTENAATLPANVVDWVLVELRDTTNAEFATEDATVNRQAALLLDNGSVVGTDGYSNLQFSNSISHQLYVVILHRNHLGVLSANPLLQNNDVYTYDFTTGISQAYNSGQKNVNDKAVLFGGDANSDGQINQADMTVWKSQAGSIGYKSADFDMNSQVDNKDKNQKLIHNFGEESQVPD